MNVPTSCEGSLFEDAYNTGRLNTTYRDRKPVIRKNAGLSRRYQRSSDVLFIHTWLFDRTQWWV